MNQTLTKIFLAAAIALVGLPAERPIPRTCHKEPQSVDCDKIRDTCNRKKGCKCERQCDGHGRRMPAPSRDDCPSWCCEDKCQCHPPCP